MAVASLPAPLAHADSTVELSPSDGSTTCPTYIRGVGTDGGLWNASTLTCTLTANPDVGPTFCVTSDGTGCGLSPMDKLIIDHGVTLVLPWTCGMAITPQNTSAGWGCSGDLAIYTEVINNGTVDADITNYGTVINYGTINIDYPAQLINLPYNGLGNIYNMQGATINSNYFITNAGDIVNNGTINNLGQFVSEECSPCIFGTFTNYGTYVGSAPAPIASTTVSIVGGNATVNQTSATGVEVTITGSAGANATVSSQAQGTAQPSGLGPAGLNSTVYFDVLVRGVSDGTARVCITNNQVSSSPPSEMKTWNRTAWVDASDQTITGSTAPLTICGEMPVSALGGSPIAVGESPSTTSTATGSPIESSGTRSSSTTSSEGYSGVPEFPVQLGFTMLATVAIVASYVFARRNLRIGKQAQI
jgi:hypothetical protein